ncbi:prolyl oligopeptidase family serine peptidase [Gimesia aquarii]|uniref:Acetyl esterase n=1 Tax=Gimesia aquarii TaxID=2527964 RepID=A0A517W3C1_9PLAN|nr:prolyl oligopeptidase family serine peptidase [Gimesia aquarii]QDT99755.1 acetyl esterase [Gimesia aquarii]
MLNQCACRLFVFCCLLIPASHYLNAAEQNLKTWLAKPIIEKELPWKEVQKYVAPRVPGMPEIDSVNAWEKYISKVRSNVLNKVVFRGEAAKWRDSKLNVVWLETISGGPEYKIQKLRFEAVPGLWVPALLYVPKQLSGKVPVVMNVNGHDRNGKAADYKQVRCINQAKRGMIALNIEWLGMGQLNVPGLMHYRMNQLDLCGTSGLAPFYLSMERGLDVLLSHPNADPERVAVAGLSGGGWQTIFISSLDKRVTLSNPVAGYSSFLTRNYHTKDLGDSEQTPNDLAVYADYTHLTAMRAPRPTLLTNNSKDNCCFESGYAQPPLLKAAFPVYKLYDKENYLQSHVNDDPGDHNFLQDNREALYRMFSAHFSEPGKPLPTKEIECTSEIKSADELKIELPKNNETFHSLALRLCKDLPRKAAFSSIKNPRKLLKKIVHYKKTLATGEKSSQAAIDNTTIKFWKLRINDDWTVPATEFSKGPSKSTTIVVADEGRKSLASTVEKLLAQGETVLAIDPFYFGESKISQRDFLYGLLVASVGERPLGIQASQLTAIARWLQKKQNQNSVKVQAEGPRSSLYTLAAAAIEPKTFSSIRLKDSMGSLKQIIEENKSVNQAPELFCFGLLKAFDIKQLVELAGSEKVQFIEPSDRVKQELPQIRVNKDVSYLGKERTEKLDLYLPDPKFQKGPYPAIIVIHGGGWHGGDKAARREQNIGNSLAKAGYVCASINYQLAKKRSKFTDNLKQVWPGHLQDCKTAVRFLRKHASQYQIDADHIGAIGGSAGGHLVAMLAVTGNDPKLDPQEPYAGFSSRIQAVIPMYGAHDLIALAQSRDLLSSFSEEEKLLSQQASAVTHVTNDDPPFLILHGTKDTLVPVEQSELLAAALKKGNIPVELLIIEGAPHSFHLQPKQKDLRPLVIGFFDRHLKP